LGHEGIPIGTGEKHNAPKTFRDNAFPLWENLFKNNDIPQANAIEVMHQALLSESKATIIVALGPLSNIKTLIEKHPDIYQKIGLILWYNSEELKNGYNYQANEEAFLFLSQKNLPIKIISSPVEIEYSENFAQEIHQLNNEYTEIWYQFHNHTTDHQVLLWDELCVIYLCYPTTFIEKHTPQGTIVIQPKTQIIPDIQVTSILNVNKSLGGVIYNELPTQGQWLMLDAREWADTIIKEHGYPEFKIVALTSEFHSHLGIYSIVGAKMGMRAMEYFHAGLDEIQVTSFAGSTPPLSCLNDGLQFGTGATLGYGNIKVSTNIDNIPAADITYNNRTIHIELNKEWNQRIEKDILALITKYGIESDFYWSELRKLSFQYWLEMDRTTMFEIN
jgi:pyrimidine-specific ribonucleoside hydrolase